MPLPLLLPKKLSRSPYKVLIISVTRSTSWLFTREFGLPFKEMQMVHMPPCMGSRKMLTVEFLLFVTNTLVMILSKYDSIPMFCSELIFIIAGEFHVMYSQ